MMILTIHPLWAWAIVYAGKDVENRTWATKYRGPLGIHAAKNAPNYGVIADFIRRLGHTPPTLAELRDRGMVGAVIGTVDLIGEEKTDSPWYLGDGRKRSKLVLGVAAWKYRGCHGWHLANPVALDTPIAATGRLGLWNFDLKMQTGGVYATGHDQDGAKI
jgi:hypothetical protein